ncbi:MAG: phospho-N-acetylmuramoyl-pentapeptide-transferase [Alphaproteobacteria bacterium]|nr:phospho-N-acetylmuramoyl-pentapeptide-transferase [Alphaproteobacteria bacterium]NDC56131.1 phospho-N-acetylmuramoyl-pentapeptide-transferase [Alphaproteobacteria bacterium]NDG03864.1 phospho-N-acetylmuramoyl-pentapeptide-transferase [Alphaproteobacteria bacterium]
MFYEIFLPLADQFIGFNLFRYITFRTGGAFLTALVVCFAMGPALIRWLKSQQGEGQPIRADGPESHHKKKGTPTMGGLMMLLAISISTLLWMDWHNAYAWIVLCVTVGFGLVGFADDYLKLTRKNPKGVSGKMRLAVQFSLAAGAVWLVMQLSPPNLSTQLALPVFKDALINLGWFFVPFAMLVVVGSSNAVNLTDGLDGLATVPVMICALSFGVIAYVVGNSIFAGYLQLHYVPKAGELAVFCGALAGACLGFLWYNAPPAQVFMGDTGSLSLGSSIGMMAVITKHELVLLIIGGLFVAETLSVILQVLSFKLTGKRMFKMAPLHHHFEKCGWPETTVVVRFWIIACVLALIGLSTLKLR